MLALEHADGTAATVQLAAGAGHKFYSGWLSEEERLDQTRWISIQTQAPLALLTEQSRRHDSSSHISRSRSGCSACSEAHFRQLQCAAAAMLGLDSSAQT